MESKSFKKIKSKLFKIHSEWENAHEHFNYKIAQVLWDEINFMEKRLYDFYNVKSIDYSSKTIRVKE